MHSRYASRRRDEFIPGPTGKLGHFGRNLASRLSFAMHQVTCMPFADTQSGSEFGDVEPVCRFKFRDNVLVFHALWFEQPEIDVNIKIAREGKKLFGIYELHR